MKQSRTYKQMTTEEKKHSLYLWNKYYQSYLEEDFLTSWHYWNERDKYLSQIGVQKRKAEAGIM
jgi:hypothetical protein